MSIDQQVYFKNTYIGFPGTRMMRMKTIGSINIWRTDLPFTETTLKTGTENNFCIYK